MTLVEALKEGRAALLAFAEDDSMPESMRRDPKEAAAVLARLQDILDPLSLAIMFHHHYERLAPGFAYDTRKETRIFDPESPNGKLMVAVTTEILSRLDAAQKEGS